MSYERIRINDRVRILAAEGGYLPLAEVPRNTVQWTNRIFLERYALMSDDCRCSTDSGKTLQKGLIL